MVCLQTLPQPGVSAGDPREIASALAAASRAMASRPAGGLKVEIGLGDSAAMRPSVAVCNPAWLAAQGSSCWPWAGRSRPRSAGPKLRPFNGGNRFPARGGERVGQHGGRTQKKGLRLIVLDRAGFVLDLAVGAGAGRPEKRGARGRPRRTPSSRPRPGGRAAARWRCPGSLAPA